MSTDQNDAPALLDIRDVAKSFGAVHVLRSVSLQVTRGEVVTVIGPSGSGKTTLLRCVNFLESYDSGSIRIDGREVGFRDTGNRQRRSEGDLAAMRAETGMVFQGFNLFPHLTAAGNIMLGLTKVRGKSSAEARSIAEHWLGRVGLAHKADSLPAELSGGQQQRVGIARAVAMGPKILLLDEITSALDPELVGEVLEVVRSLAEDGMTMVMVTHEIAFARDASSRIVFMADGGISAVGPPREILAADNTNERLRTFLARFRASHF
ncbi:amino acid ABC transporter ATP-binding protein [Mesorhizobium sp. M00.F.Ca.ET.186.01.1.1]|nr:amino acid ABC transporter ATP-binding protein [bacterium M00.F.Ca.ET.205.01.1.1]TGU51983.1 amino acid ABC transporter ATP-binding protein [bacterium M00.F.Ca.ET.152.01.1.1]TGV33378.1 amino acid ABC transporter ATP-binding protein [Mesorhizobium sp. M00.F.Ca.ET.186.01.1.1]TGZ42522.1 amino acid ABC transporter ATP-binding protein [bacterium M00.F.Ca.ET.162.01.1.1]